VVDLIITSRTRVAAVVTDDGRLAGTLSIDHISDQIR
jgi:hypothetical protein